MPKLDAKILIIDDDTDVLYTARMILKQHFELVRSVSEPERILELLKKETYDVILLDMNFSIGATSGKEGLFWLKKIMQLDPNAHVIMNTAYGDIQLAVSAMKEGAIDFVIKPWENEKLVATVTSIYKLSQSKKEVQTLRSKQQVLHQDIDSQYPEMISASPAMQQVFDTINKVAVTDATVLILGENGTGKELVARAIHRQSKRAQEAFIKVDLGAVSETLFESELFGHAKGAFTDAKEERAGRFEIASGGTLFLDEIGNLSLPLQAKLLTVLQSRMVTRVGSNKQVPIDIRLICATNMPLYEMVQNNEFRQDLLYRINTVEINLPPLRERQEDISLLADHYLQTYSRKYGKDNLKLSKESQKKLLAYHWPGNIRELQHTMERSAIMCDTNTLQPSDFMLSEQPAGKKMEKPTSYNLEEMEKITIQNAVKKHEGNLSKAAKELGFGRTTLYRKMEKYGL